MRQAELVHNRAVQWNWRSHHADGLVLSDHEVLRPAGGGPFDVLRQLLFVLDGLSAGTAIHAVPAGSQNGVVTARREMRRQLLALSGCWWRRQRLIGLLRGFGL